MGYNIQSHNPFCLRISDWIWKTDLDWLVPHQDRLVILNFLTGGAVNATSTTTVAPYHHPAAQIRDYLEKQEWDRCCVLPITFHLEVGCNFQLQATFTKPIILERHVLLT